LQRIELNYLSPRFHRRLMQLTAFDIEAGHPPQTVERGKPEVIDRLGEVAPTHAVRGNIDKGSWAAALPMTELVTLGEHRLFVLHDISQLDVDPAAAGFAAVVFGHSHRPSIETRNGILFLNPGSAGPRRFKLPITIARVKTSGQRLHADIVALQV
jgi:putative phosphoesterase